MRRLCLTCISFLTLVLLGAPAGRTIWDDSARAAANLFAGQSQAPGWSRGQQDLAINYDVCVSRMPTALQAEGYSKDPNSGGNFVAGSKDAHTAVIICSPAPEGRMLVQIVVASNGEGGGSERQCLQAQMERPGSSSGCGNTGGGGGGLAGNWIYRDSTSGFITKQIWDGNGNTSDPDHSVTGKWTIEGNELVARWSNGWVNRYRLPAVSGTLSGIAIGPSGERHSITLARQ